MRLANCQQRIKKGSFTLGFLPHTTLLQNANIANHKSISSFLSRVFDLGLLFLYTEHKVLINFTGCDFQRESTRLLSWLKALKETHGSVEQSSLSLASSINAHGVYHIGWSNEKTEKVFIG